MTIVLSAKAFSFTCNKCDVNKRVGEFEKWPDGWSEIARAGEIEAIHLCSNCTSQVLEFINAKRHTS